MVEISSVVIWDVRFTLRELGSAQRVDGSCRAYFQ